MLDNDEANQKRNKIADDCLQDMIEWLQVGGGQVGIYDGNNLADDRRREIHDKLVDLDIHVIDYSWVTHEHHLTFL